MSARAADLLHCRGDGRQARGEHHFAPAVDPGWRCQPLSFLCFMAALLFCATAAAAPTCPQGDASYPPLYREASQFDEAIASVADHEPSNERLSGITVPHHLVADHLVALGFRAASAFSYKRVIILTPDHFFAAQKPFATTTRSFDTVFGEVKTDRAAVGQLLAGHDIVEDSCLFGSRARRRCAPALPEPLLSGSRDRSGGDLDQVPPRATGTGWPTRCGRSSTPIR